MEYYVMNAINILIASVNLRIENVKMLCRFPVSDICIMFYCIHERKNNNKETRKLVQKHIWASVWDFQQCGMCDQQSLRSACAYAQSDQSLC